MKPLQTCVWQSPLGNVRISASPGKIVECRFVPDAATCSSGLLTDGIIAEAAKQLAEYFSGMRQSFDIPLDQSGDSAFQRRVWNCLDHMAPYGLTTTYGAVAAQLGMPLAARAVARVMATNMFHVIRPCHRVLAANGRLGGYAAGNNVKRALLMCERACIPPEH